MITITFPNGEKREYKKGISGIEIAKSISHTLSKKALCISINKTVSDMCQPIDRDATIELHTWEDIAGKRTFWHSSAHVLAEALEALFPKIQFGIGPPIEQGFYYDVDFSATSQEFATENIPLIEKTMLKLCRYNHTYKKIDISKEEAIAYFKKKNDFYKLELLKDLQDGEITFYQQGNFIDLCKGPHIPSTQHIKAVKILNIAGAYWRGDEKNPMMTRIYGISFPKQEMLDAYLELLEQAKKRDHRRIGKQLELFTFSDSVGAGLPLWLPKGAILLEKLENFLKKIQEKAGYQPVRTPHIAKKELYVTSGHYEKYGKDSFQPITTPQKEEFLLKPMNCPHHCEIYKSKMHSYRDLPIRFAEFGTVYRYEQSGELHGLTRVRGFTQDDAHIFCRKEQLKEEFIKVIDIVLLIFKKLQFKEYTAQLSFRSEEENDKYIGSKELWERAEKEIQEATEEKKLKTIVKRGEAAFYGPKLDFMVKDVLGRDWQMGTVQVDYHLPNRFQLEYITEKNTKETPVMIHRAPFGSMERFVAILLEHSEGNLPLWLAPIQYVVLPISEKNYQYANKIDEKMKKEGFIGSIDERNEKINRKIRDAELQKIPFMLVVGEREETTQTVTIRRKKQGNMGSQTLNDLLLTFQKELKDGNLD